MRDPVERSLRSSLAGPAVVVERAQANWSVGAGLTAVFVVAGAALLLSAGLPVASRPGVVEHAAPERPSLHAASAGDVAALNVAIERRVPAALAAELLPDGRPTVVVFLKADCGCSRRFAGWASSLAPRLEPRAACRAVVEGTAAEAEAFARETGLAVGFIADTKSGLARRWGVRKAGCFALVESDGTVAALWPGISRQGFRDLAGRLGIEPPLPDDLLAGIPGAATAGCALHSDD